MHSILLHVIDSTLTFGEFDSYVAVGIYSPKDRVYRHNIGDEDEDVTVSHWAEINYPEGYRDE